MAVIHLHLFASNLIYTFCQRSCCHLTSFLLFALVLNWVIMLLLGDDIANNQCQQLLLSIKSLATKNGVPKPLKLVKTFAIITKLET
mmetsp:Transcript_39530/g.83106  ORF Transcript_39530/g.83106 Transcript_39530/m.83106 type:complete len:87 (+) Transcript_39530:44-304(+)